MEYKYSGLLACILLIAGFAFLLYRWPLDRHKTLSQRAATNTASIMYYIALFLVVYALFITFFIGWFVPTTNVSQWFTVTFIASAAFQVGCTVVPETGGRMTQWHRILAGISALLLVPVLLILLTTGAISVLAQIMIALSLAAMSWCIYLTLRAPNREPRNFLLIQFVYFGAFLMPIMAISYLL